MSSVDDATAALLKKLRLLGAGVFLVPLFIVITTVLCATNFVSG